MNQKFIFIRVYGNPHDLNRELSRRGLFRVGHLGQERGFTSTFVRHGPKGLALQKCRRWFRERDDRSAGSLETCSVFDAAETSIHPALFT